MTIAVNDAGEALFLDGNQWKPAKRARNDQTGEELVFDGRAWKPLPNAKPQNEAPLFSGSFEEAARARGLNVDDLPTDLRATMNGESVLDTSGVRQLPAIRQQVMGQPQIQRGAVQDAAGQLPQPQAAQPMPPPSPDGQNPFDGVPDDQARQYIASLPPEQREQALTQWADAFVARERAQGGIGLTVDNAIRGLARGTPIGSFLDEANALGASLTGGSYDEALAYQRARDRSFDANNPVTSFGLQLGGGLASGVGAAKALGLGAQGGSLAAQAGRSATAGASAGGLYGFGAGEGGIGNRASSTAAGAAIGGSLGALAPLVGAGVSKAYSGATDYFRRPGGSLAGFAKDAVQRVAGGIRADGITREGAAKALREMGPEGRILDLGPNMATQASGVAGKEGPGRKMMVDAIRARADAAEARLESAVNNAVGRRVNVPAFTNQLEAQAKASYTPLYEQYRKTPVPLTPELQELFGRIQREGWPIAEAYKLASSVKNADPKQFFAEIAQDGTATIKRVPNATEWDYLKRALDRMARYGKSDGTARSYIAKTLASEVRDGVDNALSPGAPDQSIYAQARRLFADKEAIKEAIDTGRKAFARNVSPDDLREEMAQLSAPERQAFMFGARKYLEDVAGNAATRFGSNADAKISAALGTNYAAEKIRMIAPKAQAEKLIRQLRLEGQFAARDQRILQNSVTAERQAAMKALPSVPSQDEVRQGWRGLSIPGAIAEAVAGIHRLVRGGALTAKVEKSISDQARMLLANGYSAQTIIKDLIAYNRAMGGNAASAKSIGQAVKAVMNASRQPAIGAAGPAPASGDTLDRAAMLASPIPGVGDVAGVANDVRNFASGKTPMTAANIGMAALGALPFVPGIAGAVGKGAAKAADEGIIAYHGSPHTFDKFDMSKIGTGEGAQAYGHGLYFTDTEDVARGYRDTITKSGVDGAQRRLKAAGGDVQKAIAETKARMAIYESGGAKNYVAAIAEDLRALEQLAKSGNLPKGAMYQVRLNVKPDELLDWDKPLSQQPGKVRDVMQAQGLSFGQSASEMESALIARGWDKKEAADYAAKNAYESTGQHAVAELGKNAAATAKLKAAGIKGIRYLDGGSRGAGQGTYNYVIFDDKLIDILKRYGIPITIGAGGSAMVLGSDMPEEIKAQMGGT